MWHETKTFLSAPKKRKINSFTFALHTLCQTHPIFSSPIISGRCEESRFPRYWVLFSSIFAEAGWQQGSFPTTVLRRLLLSATDWHATAVFLWRNWFYYFHWTEPWLNSTLSLHSSQRYSWFTPLGVYDSSTENLAVIKFIIINTLFHMKRAFGTISLKQAWKQLAPILNCVWLSALRC